MTKIFASIILTVFLVIDLSAASLPTDTISAEHAIEYYKSILKKNKNSAFANYNMASIYFEKHDYNASLKYSKRAIKDTNEFRADAFIVYGSSLDRQGKIKEAIETFDEALKMYPNNYKLLYQEGLSCYKYRNYDKAITALEKAISIEPLFVPAHLLYGCSLFEGSNNPICVNAFLFGLLLENDSIGACQSIAFITTYLNRKPENIQIPFFEKRFTINNVDNILEEYFPPKSRKEIFSSFDNQMYLKLVLEHLKNTKKCKVKIYNQFFEEIDKNGLKEVFTYLTLSKLKNKYVIQWYKTNSAQLDNFANYLEKTLPTK